MWSSDHFGWPITARPFGATGTRQFIEVAEVLSQMVRRACLFRPAEDKRATTATTTTTITTTTTTPNVSLANRRVKSEEGETHEALKEPVVQAVVSYSNLVSLIINLMEKSVSLISNFLNDHKLTQLLHSSKMKRLNAREAISQNAFFVKNIFRFQIKIKLKYCYDCTNIVIE